MRSRGLIVSFIGMLAVLGILVVIAVIIVIGQLKKPAVGSTSTPAAVTCQQVLPLVLQNLSGTPGCGGLNASQACYANHQLTVSYGNLAANVTPPPFSDPGNIAPLESLKSIQASPLNLGLGQWGVALMKLRADLPGTVGGAPVTFIIYGDTKLEDASQTSTPAPGDANTAPLAPINAFYLSNGVTLQPSCTAVASETLPAGGLLIDSPDGRKVKFTADGAEIVIGSGVIMRAVPNQQMIVTVLHGGISVTAHGQTVSAGPLQGISVPLGGSNGLIASGPPSPAKTADIAPLALPNVCKLARAAGLNADFPINLPTATASATSNSTGPATV